MFKTSLILASAIASLATATPALASGPQALTRAVHYADLDLSSSAGRERLERRLGAAVRFVCGTASPIELRGVAEVRQCRIDTMAQIAADRRVGQVIVAQRVADSTMAGGSR